MSNSSTDVLGRVEREQEGYLEELKEYLRIPSISTDPDYRDDVLRCADFVVDRMRDAGLEARRIDVESSSPSGGTSGYPLVYGEWTGAPGKPTILFYGHYDVQPADPLELWDNPPFEPTVVGDELVARGATDDKGQSFAHLKAVAAMLAERGSLPINVKFIIEGEEESGGEAIDRFVTEDAGELLGCDAVFISDSAMYAPGQPSLIYGLKGLAYMEIKVSGPNRDLHSGSFGGGVANPLNALAQIVAKLRDPETGKIQITGFYDDVLPLEDWERREFANLDFDEDAYCRDLGIGQVFGEAGYSTLERVWARPTCDVNGIFGGYAGQGAKTVLPAWGGAKVSMRLVPGQDPHKIERLFTDYVQEIAPPGVTVEVVPHHGAPPVLVETEGPVVEAAMAAMADIWRRPVKVREGGSIPIVSTFSKVLGAPILLPRLRSFRRSPPLAQREIQPDQLLRRDPRGGPLARSDVRGSAVAVDASGGNPVKKPRLRAFVLTAGLGLRLRPLTLFLPKPLLPIRGEAVAGHTLRQLARLGCESAVLNLHHMGDVVEEHFGAAHDGLPIVYSREPEIQGTLGALYAERDRLAQADLVLLVNGDTLCSWPWKALIRRHLRSGADATMLLHRRSPRTALGGPVGVDADGMVVQLRDSEPIREVARRHIFMGAHVLAPRLLERIGKGPSDIIGDLYIPLLQEKGRIRSVITARRWHDLGTPERYLAASLDWARKGMPGLRRPGGFVSPAAEVEEAASVQRSVLEAASVVRSGAQVEGSLLLPGAVVAAGCAIRDSIIGPGVELPATAGIKRRMVTRVRTGHPPGAGDSVMGDLVYTPLEREG